MATKTFRFLLVKQIQELHNRHITPTFTLSQPHMLSSAVDSPINIKHYTKEENVFTLAANLSEKLMKNHAFQDGNKRTALLAADTFLKVNGFRLQENPLADKDGQGLAEAHVNVCTNAWTTAELAAYYESVVVPVERETDEIAEFKWDAIEA